MSSASLRGSSLTSTMGRADSGARAEAGGGRDDVGGGRDEEGGGRDDIGADCGPCPGTVGGGGMRLSLFALARSRPAVASVSPAFIRSTRRHASAASRASPI